MTKRDEDQEQVPVWVQQAATWLREPVRRSPGAVDAIMSAVQPLRSEERHDPAEAQLPPAWPDAVGAPADGSAYGQPRFLTWLTRPALSPLAAAAMVVLLLGPALWLARSRETAPQQAAMTTSPGVVRHQFVLVAPDARSVSVVGDFNAWNTAATPLRRQGSAWTVELNLPPGRHVYAFVVDGQEWVADASAPRAPVDEFGRPGSVILVPGSET